MSRELKRVPLDFSWPLNQVWSGYLQAPSDDCEACPDCSRGYSTEAQALMDQWYGYAPFRPEDRGRVPWVPSDQAVYEFADRNVTRDPGFFGGAELYARFGLEAEFPTAALLELHAHRMVEAERLCAHFNAQWSHHLNEADVAALVAKNRLMDLTHTWDPEHRWQPKVPAYLPTPDEVNTWSIAERGHDALNQHLVVEAECTRLGMPFVCSTCQGEVELWRSPEAKAAHEAWEPTEPPVGEGYQMWETVSEGSPISPVFATAEGLADWLVAHREGLDRRITRAQWLALIQGPGHSAGTVAVTHDGQVLSGVQAAVL